MAISNLRKSNVSKFLPIVSNDEVISELLSPTSKDSIEEDLTFNIFNAENYAEILDILELNKLPRLNDPQRYDKFDEMQDKLKKLNNIVSSILVTTFHSITVNISFTNDILNFISEQTYESLQSAYSAEPSIFSKINELHNVIMNQIGEFVKIIHEDYNISYPDKVNKKLLSKTNFCIKKKIPVKDDNSDFFKFKKENQFGLLGFNSEKIPRTRKYKLVLNKDVSGVTLNDSVYSIEESGRGSIFNAREVVDYKLKQSQKATTTENDNDENNLEDFLNFVDKNNNLKINENTASISYILMNNPKIRAGTKNSLELSTFFNSLSTIELSKCLPYLDVKFILPGEVETKGDNVFKTASITQFLDGTNESDFNLSKNYRVLEASFVRDAGIEGGGNTRKQNAVETNLASFTMPQTINNFDEIYTGHFESFAKEFKTNKDSLFERNNIVHDYTKPFLTIKSFNIDVAPTQGLMSFKTGKLSLILHDKARMSDIAPFIKPDLFGSFGAEIAIKYGWSHMDAINNNITSDKRKEHNYFAKFLNEKKVYEKYIITNSSYSIDANGQVNIDLAIAMKGPVSIRAINFETEKPKKIGTELVEYKVKQLNNKAKSNKNGNVRLSFSGLNGNRDYIKTEFNNNLDVNSKKRLDKMNPMFKTYNKFRSKISDAKKNNKLVWIRLVAEFFEDLAKTGDSFQVILTYKKDKENFVKISTLEDFADFKPDEKNYIWSVYSAFVSLLKTARGIILNKRGEQKKTIDGLLQKITDGLSLEDAFFDVENYAEVESISNDKSFAKNNSNTYYFLKKQGIDSNSSFKKELSPYVSLGNIILTVVGSHLSFTRGYDEIQIISYTMNDHAGAASNKNISSLLVDKSELSQFLSDLFKNGAQYTLESLLTQIIKKFFTTRYCYNYGLRDLYRINENGNVEPDTNSKKPNEFEKVVNERLQLIQKRKYNDQSNENLVPDITFVMPKIKLIFDTMTTDNSGGSDTILRISVFDQNDNPFTSVTSIMNKIFDSDVQSAVFDINKRRIGLKSLKKKSRNYSKAKAEFIKENDAVLKKLIDSGFLKEVNGELIIDTSDKYAFDSVKERLKGFMPSITYGTHNSAVIDASISTINEAKLNTVYLTRPGRNDEKIKTRARFKQDLPLRILPSQVNMTIFGCPFVNFAQYLFLDFETNTTIDNQYAITGIKHEITPGKFTTQLTLSYGDAYGKYENIVDTLSRTAQEIEQNTLELQADNDASTKELFTKDESETKNNKSLIKINQKNKTLKDISSSFTEYNNIKLNKDNLPYEVNIKSIRMINWKNKDSIFYDIKVKPPVINPIDIPFIEQTSLNKAQVDFEELIVSVSETNKIKDKTYIIDINKKIIDKNFNFTSENSSEAIFNLLILENEKSVKKFNSINAWKKINPRDTDFYKSIVDTQIDLFSAILKDFIFPYVKISIGKISNKSDIANIEFSSPGDTSSKNKIEFVFFENLNAAIKKEIIDKSKTNIVNKLNKNVKYKKSGKSNKIKVDNIEFTENGKILLVLSYIKNYFKTVKGKKITKKRTIKFKINIGCLIIQKNNFLSPEKNFAMIESYLQEARQDIFENIPETSKVITPYKNDLINNLKYDN